MKPFLDLTWLLFLRQGATDFTTAHSLMARSEALNCGYLLSGKKSLCDFGASETSKYICNFSIERERSRFNIYVRDYDDY